MILRSEDNKSLALTKPLAGKRIVVTRARAQALEFVQRLEELGGNVIEFPTIEIRPPENFSRFDEAIGEIASYDWLIVTSINGVEPLIARLQAQGKSVSSLSHLRVGAIGPQTADKLAAAGIKVGFVPSRYQAEGILGLLGPEIMRGQRVLIPRAAKARDVLPETLRAWGASVDIVEAYQTVLPAGDESANVRRLLRQDEVDLITFTSSSTVSHFARLFDDAKLSAIVGKAGIACIGPITAKTVEELGGHAEIVASEFTIAGLVAAIVRYHTGKSGADESVGN
jgi:uroporphyrinogen III methyltransferase/synthase